MSWELLTASTKVLDGLTIRIIAATTKKKSGCVIRIGRPLAERASLPFDAKGKVDVLLGTGSDAGRMRIVGFAEGAFSAHPQGKVGRVKICVPPPPGAPKEFSAVAVEATTQGDGISFSLPWHKRAADREVEEAPQWKSDPYLRQTKKPDAIAPTLDAIEEAARPIIPEPAPAPRPLFPLAHGVPARVGKLRAASVTAPARKAKQPERISEKELLAGMRRDAPVANQRLVETVRDAVEEIADKPVNNTARQHVYHDSESRADKFVFSHKGKFCPMSQRHYAFAKKLYAAMQKVPDGIIDNDTLMKEIETKEMSILQSTATALEDMVRPLGLEIVTIRKTGYRMKEVEK